MKTRTLFAIPVLFLAALLAIAGCQKESVEVAKPASDKAAVPADFALASAPEGAKDLASLKAGDVKEGDEVVVRAIVGGSVEPFVASRAVVQVIDPSVTTCDKMPGDACPTPWDACCASDDVTAKGGTVQVVGADGQPLKGTLQGVAGLAPLKEVLIKGKVHFEGEARTPVINATGIWVKG